MDIGNDDDDAYEYVDELPIARRRDPRTEDAKAAILELLEAHPQRVFYGRQVEVLLERRFFHWITARGLNEAVLEGRIQSSTSRLMGRGPSQRTCP